ncbi:bifunctional 2-polyprenyl-6-hydroxyphenol methylase/3-demethylubiquinol 3-O-methyltransferase UbiG [Emcibacter sp.]|uniref:bifunctional 2-polyprenyl-6-hydroxyphenol methylase/3-demethylubiquinol 3-O-methyltransferase UbiG n=1 Tax=Emcibacter sp. TaxID=1979954 RepID=UPI002AA91741|nr:bifunctional 2-polyprenyl-6-hydroxyphenol methylase/3-demethylubiquinol 3-O-methyltransferase UbiG [Emcibacter sp.]
MAVNTGEHDQASRSKSVDPGEIANFSALAATWWDPEGPFRPLHKMNPVRLEFIKTALCTHFNRDVTATDALKDLRILDIGCGGGLLCEPLTRLGAQMVGADASEKNIKTALAHAEDSGLDIDYRNITAEELADAGESFDAILNMEVIEHVADIPSFLDACHALLKDGGCMTLSTINRSTKAWLMAIAGAEYILRWLPVGTHDWQKFLKPSELSRSLRDCGFKTNDIKGMVYSPFSGSWSLDDHDFSVNYVALAEKA